MRWEHYHCPKGCEKPQPFWKGGLLVCGRCWFVEGQAVPVVPCTEDLCDAETHT
jgi:hypothetical protein